MCVMRWAHKSTISSRLSYCAHTAPSSSTGINANRWRGCNCGTWINHSIISGFFQTFPTDPCDLINGDMRGGHDTHSSRLHSVEQKARGGLATVQLYSDFQKLDARQHCRSVLGIITNRGRRGTAVMRKFTTQGAGKGRNNKGVRGLSGGGVMAQWVE